MVVQVVTKEQRSHLVAIVKGSRFSWSWPDVPLTGHAVPDAESSDDPAAEGPWFIFNDFVVRNISEQDALSVPGAWKVRISTSHVERVSQTCRCQQYYIMNE